ncbi:hypothetical protein DRJ12_04835 [Candidatus Acetothermia bacterium]|nr:MAG: hypothetical protein DRJ12_04835 [Candidatus Acetothermia bacterium]
MAKPTRGQVDRFVWAILLLLFGVFLLINREGIDWIGFLIAAGLLIAAALYKQAQGWGTDVLGLIFGIVLGGLGVGKHYAVDIPWIAIAAITVGIILLFEVFRGGKKKQPAARIEVSPPPKQEE